ncbi:hypothetical protein BKA66DRAFT_444092 [Pyrenochaeta sp. MPI-SDFR-AT-0127]|nr:hypothetical protein BKA66DRAFT_444092 [Pyrenochaeta sp. MPI-SDFR-AT-0127]
MNSFRRSTRTRTTISSYVEVPEDGEDIFGDEVSSPVTERPSKRRRLVVLDSDDDFDEVAFPSSTSPATSARGREHATASVPNAVAFATNRQPLHGAVAASDIPGGEKPSGEDDEESIVNISAQHVAEINAIGASDIPGGEKPSGEDDEESIANISAQHAADINAIGASDIPEGETPLGEDDEEFTVNISAQHAAEINADEEVDEEDEFFPGPDPNIEDDTINEPDIYGVSLKPEVTDAEVNPDFARKLRIILDALCEWAKGITYSDYTALAEADRPVTISTWRVLRVVSMHFLLGIYIHAIPLRVQELFLKKKWLLEDFLSLPEVEDSNANQGLYGNFPTSHLKRASKIGCESYVGSTTELKRRIIEHLAVSSRYTVDSLPKRHARSLHYRTTCRDDVVCNFRMLAQFKRPIHKGYLILLEGIFMVLLGSYNCPGYYAKYATQSSYKLVKDIRAQLDIPATPWRGLNAAWPLRQGFTSRGPRTPSQCCNAACMMMTYPPHMMPDGPKHPRALANAWNPLGGYLCRRCESYRERHGVLPDSVTLAKLVSKYSTEITKSQLRQTGQPVVCSNCGDVEGPDGAVNSANGGGTRHIASNGKIRCSACDTYLRMFGKERDIGVARQKAARDQAKADREAGRPVRCKHCATAERAGKRPHISSKQGGMSFRALGVARKQFHGSSMKAG